MFAPPFPGLPVIVIKTESAFYPRVYITSLSFICEGWHDLVEVGRWFTETCFNITTFLVVFPQPQVPLPSVISNSSAVLLMEMVWMTRQGDFGFPSVSFVAVNIQFLRMDRIVKVCKGEFHGLVWFKTLAVSWQRDWCWNGGCRMRGYAPTAGKSGLNLIFMISILIWDASVCGSDLGRSVTWTVRRQFMWLLHLLRFITPVSWRESPTCDKGAVEMSSTVNMCSSKMQRTQ